MPLASRRKSELLHLSMDCFCFQRQSVCFGPLFGVATQSDWQTRLPPPARQSSVNCACQARVFPAVNLDVKCGVASQTDLGRLSAQKASESLQNCTGVLHLSTSGSGRMSSALQGCDPVAEFLNISLQPKFHAGVKQDSSTRLKTLVSFTPGGL